MTYSQWRLTTTRILFACFMLSLFDCTLEGKVNRLSDELKELRSEMQLTWGNALCSDDVRFLVQQVSAECAASLKNASGTRAAGVCTDNSINTALVEADPKGQGRFLLLMGSQRHVVFYIAPGETGLSAHRVQKLGKRLLEQKILSTTRFLLATDSLPNPSPVLIKDKRGRLIRPRTPSPEFGEDEGLRRINLVADYLHNAGIPTERILKWLFKFTIDSSDFSRVEDKPALGESSDPYSGIWVVRVDCGEPLKSDSTPIGGGSLGR